MPFQFYCPQGHLLEGHEHQMGTPGQCPMCGAMFVFPQVGASGAGAMPGAPAGGAGYGGGSQFGPPAGPAGGFAPPAPEPQGPRTYRILCPKGHQVHTPEEMMGTKAQCPYCNAVIDLKFENSVEFKEEEGRKRRAQELQQRIEDERRGKFWMKIAILAALLIIGGFGTLIYLIFSGTLG